MTTEFRFVRRDGCPKDNCTYELNPDCCGEGESRTDEHDCIWVCEGCGESRFLLAAGLDYGDTDGPTGWCMPCEERMRYVCRDSVDGNGKCPVEREEE